MMKTSTLTWFIAAAALVSIAAPSFGASGGQGNLVVALRGSASPVPSTVPDIDGDGVDDDALCYEVMLVNLHTDNVIGSASDCLSNVELFVGDGSGGPLDPLVSAGPPLLPPTSPPAFVPLPAGNPVPAARLVNTTIFRFPQGDLVQRGVVTIQRMMTPSTRATHATAALPETNNILSGTRRFANVSGKVRLSGAVDMSAFPDLTLDCIFVIDLD